MNSVVQLEGDIDLGARARVATQLKGAADDAIAAGTDLCVDASQVTFMDSTGVGLIVQTSLAMRAAGLEVRLTSTPAIVRRVFEISGLSDLLVG